MPPVLLCTCNAYFSCIFVAHLTQGKGSMKTYWLQGKKGQASSNRRYPESQAPLPAKQESKRRKSSVGARSVYSPVTYEEIAKHSPCSTPPPQGSGGGPGGGGSLKPTAGVTPASTGNAAGSAVVKEIPNNAAELTNGASPKRRTMSVAPTTTPIPALPRETNGCPVPRKTASTELELKVPPQAPASIVTVPPPAIVSAVSLQPPCQHCTHCHNAYNQRKLADVSSTESRGDKTGCWASSPHRGAVSSHVASSAGGSPCAIL